MNEWGWAPLATDERRALRESVASLADKLWGPAELADHPDAVVEELRAGLGALGVELILVPEADGGAGGEAADAAALATEIGLRMLPFVASEVVGAEGATAAMLDLFEMAGAMQGLLDRTARHLGQRVQFGRPLLELQALQHRLADLSLQSYVVETAALGALLWLDAPDGAGAVAPLDVHETVRSTYQDAAETALQLHGALGFTWEGGFRRYLDHALGMVARGHSAGRNTARTTSPGSGS
jgi:alkylation response protein AidB-like acyl-CoA dehydrogenase